MIPFSERDEFYRATNGDGTSDLHKSDEFPVLWLAMNENDAEIYGADRNLYKYTVLEPFSVYDMADKETRDFVINKFALNQKENCNKAFPEENIRDSEPEHDPHCFNEIAENYKITPDNVIGIGIKDNTPGGHHPEVALFKKYIDLRHYLKSEIVSNREYLRPPGVSRRQARSRFSRTGLTSPSNDTARSLF